MTDLSYRERQALSLGATLYVPATHKDLASITGSNRTGAHSIVICTEDAVAEHELDNALANLAAVLPGVMSLDEHGIQVFIRPRNEKVLGKILSMEGVANVAGFVLPKFNLQNAERWGRLLTTADPLLGVMPTLETKEVFDTEQMKRIAKSLKNGSLASRIIAIRIGGNDLLHCLSIRRPRCLSIYDTPVGRVIAELVGIFRPEGFYLTAPVFEYLNDTEGLRRELKIDRAHGLIGKTAIHPSQINIIEEEMMPTTDEVKEAMAILDADAKAVFKMNGGMCEVATHYHWAKQILFLANRKRLAKYPVLQVV